MQYAIIDRKAWNGPQPVAETPGCVIVDHRELHALVEAMIERNALRLYPSVAQRLESHGRVFLAAPREVAQRTGSPGILVEKVK